MLFHLRVPGGVCTKFGYDVEGRQCAGAASVCTLMRSLSSTTPSTPACSTGCAVGAEPKAQRLGVDGHGEGCRAGRENTCIGLHDDVSFCAHECSSAADCAAGFACADNGQAASTSRLCYPGCFTAEGCRSAEACELAASGAGQCVAMPLQGE